MGESWEITGLAILLYNNKQWEILSRSGRRRRTPKVVFQHCVHTPAFTDINMGDTYRDLIKKKENRPLPQIWKYLSSLRTPSSSHRLHTL